MKVLGAVLVGGASSRFGSDKAGAVWDGAALADHAAAAIAPFVEAVVRIGGGGVPDLPRSGLGPLGGIAGALDHARREGFDGVLTIACDMPRLPDGLVEALLANAPAYCADVPVLGHWPAALAEGLLEHLASFSPSPRACPGVHRTANSTAGRRAAPWMPGQARHDGGGKNAALSVRRWATTIGAIAISSPTPIANINTPADLAAL